VVVFQFTFYASEVARYSNDRNRNEFSTTLLTIDVFLTIYFTVVFVTHNILLSKRFHVAHFLEGSRYTVPP